MHIGVESADLSVARVGERVKEGVHPVPEENRKSQAKLDEGTGVIEFMPT